MTVYTFHDDLLSVDKQAVFLAAIDMCRTAVCLLSLPHLVRVTVFDCTEAELLTLHMQDFPLLVFQREDSSITVRLLSIPQLWIPDYEIYPDMVTDNRENRTYCHFLPVIIDNLYVDRTTGDCTIQEHIRLKSSIHSRIHCYTLDILCGFRNNINGTPDTSEIPIVGTTFCHIHLTVGTFFGYFYFQSVLFRSEEHTIRHIHLESCKTTLMKAQASLPSVDFHVSIGKYGFKGQQYLSPLPCLRQLKFILVLTLFIGNTLRLGDAIEAHTILISAKTL